MTYVTHWWTLCCHFLIPHTEQICGKVMQCARQHRGASAGIGSHNGQTTEHATHTTEEDRLAMPQDAKKQRQKIWGGKSCNARSSRQSSNTQLRHLTKFERASPKTFNIGGVKLGTLKMIYECISVAPLMLRRLPIHQNQCWQPQQWTAILIKSTHKNKFYLNLDSN